MTKKVKCPKCGTEDEGDFTVWKKGEVGCAIYFDGTDIEPDEIVYDETYVDVIACQCGHESQLQSDFLVEVRE